MNGYTKKKSERFLLVVAICGLALMLLLAWVAYARADVDSGGTALGTSLSESYVVYELGTGITGTLTDLISYGESMNLNGNFYIYRHNSQWTSGAVYDGAGTTFYSLNGGTTYSDRYEVNGLSIVADPTKWYYLAYIPVNTGAKFTGWSSDEYAGYGWHNYGDYATSYSTMGGIYDPRFAMTGWSSPVFPEPVVNPTITITTPSAGYTDSTSTIPFEFHIVPIEAGSYQVSLLFEKQGLANFYIANAGGLSIASPFAFDIGYDVTNLTSATYTNFYVNLLKNGQVVASTSTGIQIVLTGGDTGGFGGGTYYLGSSTAYYEAHVPAFFTDNDLGEPSDFYTEISGFIDDILNKIYGITGSFQQFFSNESARTYGGTVNSAVLTVWGYVNDADALLGGYPFAFTLFMYLIIMLSMFVIKAVKTVLLR